MNKHQNYTRIFVRDLAAQLRVGIHDYEKAAPQTVMINLECESIAAHYFDNPAEEGFEHALDYTQAYHFIVTELAEMSHIPLLESVAEIIASFCFRDPRIASVRVRLEKPNILPRTQGAGVEIFRMRKPT